MFPFFFFFFLKMKIYSKFWRKFSQLKSIFYFSFLSIMAEPSATEAYHIRITQFVFIFAVAHILFSLPHLWSKAPILCVFSILYKLKLPPFIVCAFQQALAFLYKTMKWIKKNCCMYMYNTEHCIYIPFMSSISSHTNLSIFVAGLESV